MAERDVRYERIVLDDLPERPQGDRGSWLNTALDEIKADTETHGKFVCVAQYNQPSAATAAANVCRKRLGKPEANGWWFGTRKVQIDGEDRTGLFVSYDPSRIVPGEAEKHEVEKTAWQETVRAKNREKAAAKKARENGGDVAKKAPAKSSR